jgi:hypothetical protein
MDGRTSVNPPAAAAARGPGRRQGDSRPDPAATGDEAVDHRVEPPAAVARPRAEQRPEREGHQRRDEREGQVEPVAALERDDGPVGKFKLVRSETAARRTPDSGLGLLAL